MKVAIVGAGLIGRKRALNLAKGCIVDVVCDIDRLKGEEFAKDFGCSYEKDWRKVVTKNDVNIIFVATTHNWLTPIGIEAIKKGKHVFLEKPGARSLEEFRKLIKAQKSKKVVVMLGYNHRYHPAIKKAKKIIELGKYGRVMFIRAKYGHGARLGYEKEWRFVKKISGGGELIDQGPHLIDLVNYLVGPMQDVIGYTGTLFWKTKLEDSAFWIMKNKKGQMAELSVTCVEWKNIFCFEIMLEKAKIQIDGLGRSYGVERLTLYKMKPKMGPPDVSEYIFDEDDLSWKKENNIFLNRIRKRDYSPTALLDGMYVHEVVKKLYMLNKKV